MPLAITRDMELEDVASQVPRAIRALSHRNIVCIQCGTPLWKTVAEAITDAGYEDIDGIIAEVNREVAEAAG